MYTKVGSKVRNMNKEIKFWSVVFK